MITSRLNNALSETTGCPKKMLLTLTFYFEAVTTIMSSILGLPAFLDMYNSFDYLLI